MTIEEFKQKILEITKSHQKLDTHYGIIYAMLDPLTNQEQSTLPSEIVQARKIFDQILESVSEQQYQFILDKLDKNFYHHNGNLLFGPFVKFVLETSKKQIDGVDTFLDSSNLKQLRSIYRKFKGDDSDFIEEDSQFSHSKDSKDLEVNLTDSLQSSESPSNSKDLKNSESINENTADMHSKTSETISYTKDSKNLEMSLTDDQQSSESPSNSKNLKNSETINVPEYEIKKELSPEAIANAEKLRRSGLQLFDTLIDDIMNTPLDPAIQKIMDAKDDLPINNIRERETPTTDKTTAKVKKDKDKKTNWTIFGIIALSGVAGLALAHFLHSRNAASPTSHLIQANIGSTGKIPIMPIQQIVKSTENSTTVNGHQKILPQYDDLDSLASAVMDILEDKDIPTTPRKPSRDKYADIPSAKELFGSSSY